MRDEAGRGGTAPPDEVVRHIYRLTIPLPGNPLKAVNSYVVKGRERNLIIDTGMRRKECFYAMMSGLDALGIGLDHTDFFITHFHSDHLGLVSDLASETSRIYLNGPDTDSLFAQKFRQVFERSARLHGFPEGELNFEWNDGANSPDAPPVGSEGIGRLHGKNGGNILALDGHVDYLNTNVFNRLSLNRGPGPGGKGLLWWDPNEENGGFSN